MKAVSSSQKKQVKSPEGPEEALKRAREAQARIGSSIRKTAIQGSRSGSEQSETDLFFKYENQQITGSFKIRGALNKILSLEESEKKNGVIASSAGNHSQGVAYSASITDVSAKIIMPVTAPLIKVSATKGYGAEVELFGEYYDLAYKRAQELAQEEQRTFIHPYQDDKVIAGQSTIALELHEQIPGLDTIVVPVGGGGLISGVAMVSKALNPKCKVIGVQADNMSAMNDLFNGLDHFSEFKPTLADGIAVKEPSEDMLKQYIEKYVDEMVTVTEEEIAQAMVFLLERKKAVTEGAAATSLAAIFSGRCQLGQKTCSLISGGNVDINMVSRIIQRGLLYSGRMANISVVFDDYPGTMAKIAEVIGQTRANILEINHSRSTKGLALRQTQLQFLLETIDESHIEKIREAMKSLGGRVIDEPSSGLR